MAEMHKWKVQGLFKADVNEVLEEIRQNSNDESITPKMVVEIAKSEDSCMHGFFEWDDKIAGQQYREIQAAKMLRNIEIVPLDEEEKPKSEPLRYFEVDSSRTSTYKPVRFFMRNVDEYQSLLDRAKAELESFKRRYATLTEMDTLLDEIDRLLMA